MFYTLQGHEDNLFTKLHLAQSFLFSMFTVWHGLFLWYSCFPGWELKRCPYLQYEVRVYTQFWKHRTMKFNSCSYGLYLVKISIFFCLSEVGIVPGQIYQPVCLGCTITSTNLSVKHATIVEWSGTIYQPNVPIWQDFWTDLLANRNQSVNTITSINCI